MQVEVWSDVVCPWCYIGKRRLEQAIADLGDAAPEIEIIHRGYQLDPTASSDGIRVADYLAEKYDITPEQALDMMDDVAEVAETVGLDYDLSLTIHGNTRDAHRLILWAQTTGDAAPLLEAMYSGYFEHGRSVFTPDALLEFVAEAGLDVDAARAVLASDAFDQQVVDDQTLAAQFGANGVPFFVVDRKYGISGAQPLEVFTETLRRASGS